MKKSELIFAAYLILWTKLDCVEIGDHKAEAALQARLARLEAHYPSKYWS